MDSPTHTPPQRTFWRRRVVDPILALLTQGVSAEKIALTLAVGAVCSLFPLFGTTSLLTLVVGVRLRMNQPILQTLNQLLGPVQLAMLLVYVRLGEWIWRAGTDDRFTVAEMLRVFREETLVAFFDRFGTAGGYAITAWLVTAPVLFAAVYLPLRPILLRFERRPGRDAAPAGTS